LAREMVVKSMLGDQPLPLGSGPLSAPAAAANTPLA